MLQEIFNPQSVAIIGANDRPGSVGLGLVKNLLEGKKQRKVFLVNPYLKKILGLRTYPRILDVKEEIDLAIIAVKAHIVPNVLKECTQKKVKGVIVISSGFSETGKQGEKLERKIKAIIKNSQTRLIGPNCLGIIRPSFNLNASFAPATPNKGEVAFLSQSGALIDALIDKSLEGNLGFSIVISYGNEADLSLVDFLEFLENDEETNAIVIYLEGLKKTREFFELSYQISQKKPVVVLKGGRTREGEKAVKSHTASLAGSYEIFSGACQQFNLIEADTIEELFDFAKALAWQPRIKNQIAVVSNAGGGVVLASDYSQELNLNLIETRDIIGDADSQRYEEAIFSLLKKKNISGMLVIQTLQIMTDPIENAKIIIRAKKAFPGKTIITCFLGGKLSKRGVDLLEKNKIPNYPDVKRALKALKILIKN